MRTLRTGVVLLAAVLVVGGFVTTTQAFHDGGVATCTRCHSMHNPQDTPAIGKLLTASDQSSTCLNCHQGAFDTGPRSYHVSSTSAQIATAGAPIQRSPGGDFGWLRLDYFWNSRGTDYTELGETHGHNIIAADFGYGVDGTPNAPGGGASPFPSSLLGCQSCHDPHGKGRITDANTVLTNNRVIIDSGSYDDSPAAGDLGTNEAVGVYRLLAYNGYTQDGVTFDGVPVAVAPHSYNRSEAAYDTRVAYGVGTANGFEAWGNWCGTCHEEMHSTVSYTHPVDQGLGATVQSNYNSYVQTGVFNGTIADSFTSLVPFASFEDDRDLLKPLAAVTTNPGPDGVPGNADDFDEPNLAGPGTNDQVTCLSCHRAHASGFPYALRWFQDSEFITEGGAYPAANGRTAAQMEDSYYDRPATVFASYQRSLCNKCHAKD